MLRICQKIIYRRVKTSQFHSFSKLCPKEANGFIKPVYFNTCKMKIVTGCTATNGWEIRKKHREAKAGVSSVVNDAESFESLLHEIEDNEKDLTVEEIMCYINEMHNILDSFSVEDHHTKELMKNPAFIKLFEAIHDLMDEISARDLICILKYYNRLKLPIDSNFNVKILKKLEKSFEVLDFHNKIYFLEAMIAFNYASKNKNMGLLAKRLASEIYKEIENKNFYSSPEDTVAAFHFLRANCHLVTVKVKRNILNAVLDLKFWNDHLIFKSFLLITSMPPIVNDLRNKYFEKVKEEIRNKNKYCHHFILGYADLIKSKPADIDYDENLIEEVLAEILKSDLKIRQITTLLHGVTNLRHCHYGLAEYLVHFLEQNSVTLISHPTTAALMFEYISNCIHGYEMENLCLTRIKNVVSSLNEMLAFLKTDKEQYFYKLLRLARLEIFSNEELNRLSEYFSVEKNFRALNRKEIRFLLTLNEAVKLLHPNYTRSLLNENAVSVGLRIFGTKSRNTNYLNRNEVLINLKKSLETSFGVDNCVLLNYRNKLAQEFDAIVAVNKEGKFHNFGTNSFNGIETFVEDIFVPSDFKKIAITYLTEQQHSRNNLVPNGIACLRLKIKEKLGFLNVILHQRSLKNLPDQDVAKLIYKRILEKIAEEDR